MMKDDDSRIRVGLAPILVRQSGLHPGNQTVGARLGVGHLLKVLHAVIHVHRRRGEGSIADCDAFGCVLWEKMGRQDGYVGICVCGQCEY